VGEAGAGRVDDLRVDRADGVDVNAEPVPRAGQEVRQEDVAGADQLVQHARGLGLLQGQPEAALAAVGPVHDRREARSPRDEVLAEGLDQATLRISPLGVLDLDDVGAPVRQDGTGRRDEGELGDL